MQRKGKPGSSIFEKLLIGGIGLIGGVLLGKAISDNVSKSQKYQAKTSDTEIMNQNMKKNIQQYDSLQELMTCPISGQLMTDPVIIKQCGHTFEKKHIQAWIQKEKWCPLCKQVVQPQSLQTNFQLRQVIKMYQRQKQTTKGNMKKSEQ